MANTSQASRRAVAAEPPQDLSAEEGVLGGLLVWAPACDQVISGEKLRPGDFYFDRYGEIFDAICDLHRKVTPVDSVTVCAALRERGKLDEVGGADRIAELAATAPAAGNARHYAQLVKGHALTRAKRLIGQELTNGLAPHDAIERLRRLGVSEGLRARSADLSRARPVRWAWDGRLPLGYLSLLLGAEGVGKGVLTAWILARLTRGELDGELKGRPARILVVGDEDSWDSVTMPRLHVAGADLGLVDTLAEDDESDLLDLRRDASALRELLAAGKYRVIYIDALLDTLGADVDDWRSKGVRDALRPIRRIARELDVLALGTLHPNKGQRGNFRDLVSGSHAFNASSRSSLLLALDPADEDRRVLVRGKGNLAAAPPSFGFGIEGRNLELNGHAFDLPMVTDPANGDLGIDDLVKPQREAPVRESLADEIDELGTGDVQSRADIAAALGRSNDDRSVGRALDQLEDQGRWEKQGRGKWRSIGIGASSEAPMSNEGDGGKK